MIIKQEKKNMQNDLVIKSEKQTIKQKHLLDLLLPQYLQSH